MEAAAAADVAIVVVGDRAGLFGRGTVGEGNDVESLELPGVQRELVEAVVATGTPVVMVLLTGRPYAIDWALDAETAPRAVLQAFFPGEEGAPAIASILAGETAPSGRLPVSLPRSAGSQPYSYLHPILGGPNEITSASSAPVRPFGFGLSYTSFSHSDLGVQSHVRTDDAFTVSVRVRNDRLPRGHRRRAAVRARRVRVRHAPRRSAAGLRARRPRRRARRPSSSSTCRRRGSRSPSRGGERIVEPGAIRLWVGASCADRETTGEVGLTGPDSRRDGRRSPADRGERADGGAGELIGAAEAAFADTLSDPLGHPAVG